MKSLKNGISTSDFEILNISGHGFWIHFSGKEYFVPFEKFPWFKEVPVGSILNFTADQYGNFYWPDLDIDLNTKILENPDNYPLVSR